MKRRSKALALLSVASTTALAGIVDGQSPATGETSGPDSYPSPGTQWSEAWAISNGYLGKSVNTQSDGSVDTVYSSTEFPGSMTYVEPPAGFSPLTASAADLAKYAFPPRPTGGPALSSWIQAMSNYSGGTTPKLSLYFQGQPTAQTSLAAPASSTGSAGKLAQSSSNWAGWVNTPGSNGGYIAVEAEAEVPVLDNTCPSPVVSDAWVGLGGTSASHPLIQDGIAYNDPTSGSWEAIFELMEANGAGNVGPAILDGGIPLSSGNTVFMYSDYIQSEEQADFYIENTTTGKVAQGYKNSSDSSIPLSNYWDGSSAEWIMEETASSYLQQFANEPWSYAYAETTNGDFLPVSGNPNVKYYQQDGNGTVVDLPGALNSAGSGWTQEWGACS